MHTTIYDCMYGSLLAKYTMCTPHCFWAPLYRHKGVCINQSELIDAEKPTSKVNEGAKLRTLVP